MHVNGSGLGAVAGFCEECNDPSGSIRREIYSVSNCQILKKVFDPGVLLLSYSSYPWYMFCLSEQSVVL
jgi:hypothetical protein